jgi:hypothetical protein
MKYVLFVFTRQKNQRAAAEAIAQEISGISTSDSIKYFYGAENIIITFDSVDETIYVNEFFEAVLGGLFIPFFITPYLPDKMSFWFEGNAEKHLFGTDKCVQEEDYTDEDKKEVQNLMFKTDEAFEQALTEGYNEAEKFLNKSAETTPRLKKYTPTLDELLDKINASGMGSLTTEEKELLTNYSK